MKTWNEEIKNIKEASSYTEHLGKEVASAIGFKDAFFALLDYLPEKELSKALADMYKDFNVASILSDKSYKYNRQKEAFGRSKLMPGTSGGIKEDAKSCANVLIELAKIAVGKSKEDFDETKDLLNMMLDGYFTELDRIRKGDYNVRTV